MKLLITKFKKLASVKQLQQTISLHEKQSRIDDGIYFSMKNPLHCKTVLPIKLEFILDVKDLQKYVTNRQVLSIIRTK